MPRYTTDNTEGYSKLDLMTLNLRYEEAVYLPSDTLARMNDIEIKSWQDHVSERVLADFDEQAEQGT